MVKYLSNHIKFSFIKFVYLMLSYTNQKKNLQDLFEYFWDNSRFNEIENDELKK